MKKVLFSVFAILFSFQLLANEYRDLTESEIVAIETSVNDELKDPFSSKFKHNKFLIKNKDGNENTSYCGSVNAKNSYGAYTGYKTFIVILLKTEKTLEDKAVLIKIDNGDRILDKICLDKGLVSQ